MAKIGGDARAERNRVSGGRDPGIGRLVYRSRVSLLASDQESSGVKGTRVERGSLLPFSERQQRRDSGSPAQELPGIDVDLMDLEALVFLAARRLSPAFKAAEVG